MNIALEPVLSDLRAIYDLADARDRYWQYVNLMTKDRGELLPLGDFSPMGLRQASYLDALIAIDAEKHAAKVCSQVSDELSADANFRVMLVVVDEPKNGWTQRSLTDADARFSDAIEHIAKNKHAPPFDRWVVVQLWTTTLAMDSLIPTLDYVERQTRAAIFRAYWQRLHGYARSLRQMLSQEGAVMRFAREEPLLDAKKLQQTSEVLGPLMESMDYTINFAALYGDEAAMNVGYTPLGLSERAGFALALANTTDNSLIRS